MTESGRDPGHPVPCPISRGPLGIGRGGEGKERGTRQGLGGEWALPSIEPSDVAPEFVYQSSFTAVRVSLVFFSRTNCALCIEPDLLPLKSNISKKQLRLSSQPDLEVFCRHDRCLSDDGVLPGDAKAISSFLRNLVTGFASIGLDKTEVIVACPDFPGCTWTATRNFTLLGAAMRDRQWCESLLCKRVAKASALIRARVPHGAFTMLRSCAGRAQILNSCRTVPPSLQSGALAQADFEIISALDRLVGSPLSDDDWRLASLGISSRELELARPKSMRLPHAQQARPPRASFPDASGPPSMSTTLILVVCDRMQNSSCAPAFLVVQTSRTSLSRPPRKRYPP